MLLICVLKRKIHIFPKSPIGLVHTGKLAQCERVVNINANSLFLKLNHYEITYREKQSSQMIDH